MKKVAFDLRLWREGLPKKTSKLKAADKLGIDGHTYNKYEREGVCPLYIMRAARDIKTWG